MGWVRWVEEIKKGSTRVFMFLLGGKCFFMCLVLGEMW